MRGVVMMLVRVLVGVKWPGGVVLGFFIVLVFSNRVCELFLLMLKQECEIGMLVREDEDATEPVMTSAFREFETSVIVKSRSR